MAIVMEFLKQQWTSVPALEGRDLSGQTVVVTGASGGLGLEMGRMLAKMSVGRLILTSRYANKCSSTLEELKKETGNQNIEFWDLDLNSNASIKAFAAKMEDLPQARLDLLYLNAGIQLYKFSLSEGKETTFQTNVYGTYLLALLLHPLMKRTTGLRGNLGPSRTVITSSDTHTFFSTVPLEDFLAKVNSAEATQAAEKSKDAREQQLAISSRYALSKFALQTIFGELAKHLDPQEVLFATANPGLCKTNLTQNLENPILKFVVKPVAFAIVARSAETGARCILYPGLIENGSSIHGRYFSSSMDYPVSSYVQSDEVQSLGQDLYKDMVEDLAKVDSRASQPLK